MSTVRTENLLTQSAETLRVPARTPHPSRTIDRQWLRSYETNPDSIFNYYSVENEVDFLRKTASLPEPEREFYVDENIKRFLGEFVGKIPYTTVPYVMREDGLNYGELHVMDSYRRAADHGQERERAETEGFARIEQRYIEEQHEKKPLSTAVWISPPKTADYGFVFIMQPEADGHIKEYVVRYDEQRGKTDVSNRILRSIDGSRSYGNTEEFLLNPLFLDPSRIKDNLPVLLRTAGVDEDNIAQSVRFESAVSHQLSGWIRSYTETVLAASEADPPDPALIDEAKTTLLTIYSYAGRLRDETAEQTHADKRGAIDTDGQTPLTVDDLAMAYLLMQQNAPRVVDGGSCPVVRRPDGLPGDQPSFVSNSDMLRALTNGKTIEDILRDKTFPCPKCGYAIPSGEGRTECPNCHITKEKYAREIGGKSCD